MLKYNMTYSRFPTLLDTRNVIGYLVLLVAWFICLFLVSKVISLVFNNGILPLILHIGVIKHMLAPSFEGFQATHICFFIQGVINAYWVGRKVGIL